jgi:hypothetical protein
MPDDIDILEPQTFIAIELMVIANAIGEVQALRGVDSIVMELRRGGVKPQYEIGPISFSCEDSAQLRYLVTFTATVSLSGSAFTVREFSKNRIGDRPNNTNRDKPLVFHSHLN